MAPQDIGAERDEDEEAERALLAAFLFRSPERQLVAGEQNGLTLGEVQRSLSAWLRSLTGRDFRLAAADPPSTDGTDIFLPRAVPAPREDTDQTLFRCMGLVQLGLVHFGLLDSPGVLLEIYRDWVLRSCYHLLACHYTVGRWSAIFPGIAVDFHALKHSHKPAIMRVNLTVVPGDGMPAAFRPLYHGLVSGFHGDDVGSIGEPARVAVQAVDKLLANPESRSLHQRSRAAPLVLAGQARKLREHFRRLRLGPPPIPYFCGILRPEWVLALRERDPEWEGAWKKGSSPLRQLRAAQALAPSIPDLPTPPGASLRGLLRKGIRRALQGPGDPAELAKAPAYGVLRDEHQAQQRGHHAAQTWSPDTPIQELLAEEQREDDDGTEYDEWSHEDGVYRVAAVRVVERPATSGPLAAYQQLVEANRRPISEIRRRFEALRLDERWLHAQADGSEIDLDRAIQAICDVKAGQDPDPRIFMRFQRERQQVAILTLVDLSGSTQGRVIHLEQEALILFAEGLRTLSFPHAFYGFHNTTPGQCLMERIKAFDEFYDESVFRRLGNLRPGGGTRMGAFIRHATALLAHLPQSRRVMMVLSDGRPEDRGEYRGDYGINDTAMAVWEARRAGVHVHCISMDPHEESHHYLERIFGRGRFLALAQVEQLPQRLPEVFRDLIG